MLNADSLAKYEENGYVVLDDFLTLEECQQLKSEIAKITESEAFLEDLKNLPTNTGSFKLNVNISTNYFLESNDKIRGFLEQNVDLNNSEKKSEALWHKIGHALHVLNPVFKAASYNEKTEAILRQYNFIKPVICQSMYIFKQPFVGGEIRAHQDASYLYAEPINMVGFWIALEDATVENGCLQFIPGSHKEGVLSRRFIRNPNREEFDAGKGLIYTADEPNLKDEDFVHVPVKAGSVLLIHGLVRHRSSANQSPKSRHAYTFHVYDAGTAKYSDQNWLLENPTSFIPVYDDTTKGL